MARLSLQEAFAKRVQTISTFTQEVKISTCGFSVVDYRHFSDDPALFRLRRAGHSNPVGPTLRHAFFGSHRTSHSIYTPRHVPTVTRSLWLGKGSDGKASTQQPFLHRYLFFRLRPRVKARRTYCSGVISCPLEDFGRRREGV